MKAQQGLGAEVGSPVWLGAEARSLPRRKVQGKVADTIIQGLSSGPGQGRRYDHTPRIRGRAKAMGRARARVIAWAKASYAGGVMVMHYTRVTAWAKARGMATHAAMAIRATRAVSTGTHGPTGTGMSPRLRPAPRAEGKCLSPQAHP